MRRLLALWLLALLGLGLAACDDDDGGGGPAQDGPLGADAAQDAARDADRPDSRVRDRGTDAVLPGDRGPDGDLPVDAAVDRGPDAASDGGGPEDAGPDAGLDAASDASTDAAPDAEVDAALPDLAPPLDQGEALSLVIDAPPEGALTNLSPIQVRGRVDRPATVLINGVEAPVEGGRFTLAVPLVEGPNALRAEATAGEETAEATVNVVLDTVAPVVAWVAPAPGTVSNQAALTVRGTVDDASAAVTVNGAAVALAEGVFETQLVLAEGPNTLVAEARDAAGNLGRAEVVVTFDPSAPTLVVTQPLEGAVLGARQVTVAGTAEGAGVSVTVDGAPAPLVGGAFQVVLNRPEGPQSVTVVARNPAGSEARVVRAFRIDTVAPGVVIRSPAADARLIRDRVEVTGNLDEPATVTVNGVEATVNGLTFRAADVPLVEGANTLVAVATDAAGNVGQAEVAVTVDTRPPAISLTEPEDGVTVSGDSVAVSGLVDPNDVVSVEVNGLLVPIGADGRFTAPQVPVEEGRTLVTAIATDAFGNVGLVTVRVFRDTKPPMVRIETPQDGEILNLTQVDVAGITNDLVAGVTVGEEDVRVFVNGVPAQVQNRTFVLPELLLQLGPNVITVEAVDAAGNRATRSIRVTVDPSAGQRIVQISGAGQTAALGQPLARPLVVSLLGANGDPVPHTEVVFEVSRGDGALVAFPERGREVRVTTDENGLASVGFEPGGRAGAGSHRVVASAPGFVGRVEFCTSVRSGAADRIAAMEGEGQTAAAGDTLPEALVALVVDAEGNPVAGEALTFEVVNGGGDFSGQPSVTVLSDEDGLARATPRLGAAGEQTFRVRFAGLAAEPPAFRATAVQPGAREATRVVGRVLDNQDVPLPGVTAWIRLPAGPVISDRTDANGEFAIEGAPVGPVHLVIEGATAERADGTWPGIQFDLVTVAGVDNTVGRDIYLPRMDLEGAGEVGGPEDVVLRLAGVPGSELTIFGGSARCPEGAARCTVSWSQVRADRLPDPPPLGSNFSVVWTLQPSGVDFDPPVRVCIPNPGHAPGHQLEIFSFDHDLATWVGIGTATVSADGQQACTDEGFGIFKSGWGGAPPPPPPPRCPSSCDTGNRCKTGRCVDGACQYENANEGGRCDDGSGCGEATCEAGSCVFSSQEADGTACDDRNQCTQQDACQGGACVGTDPPDCEVEDPCVEGYCSPATGCEQRNRNGATCTPEGGGSACVETYRCVEGACEETPKECEQDDNPCTEKECREGEGCVDKNIKEGERCREPGPNDQCGEYICQEGTCGPDQGQQNTNDQACDDENPCTEEDKCTDGQCKGTDRDTNRVEGGIDLGLSRNVAPAIDRARAVINRVPWLSVQRFTGGVGRITAFAEDCCNPETEFIRQGKKGGGAEASFSTGISATAPGLGFTQEYDENIGSNRLAYSIQVGIFVDVGLSVTGRVTYASNRCYDEDGCTTGSLGVGLTGGLSARVAVQACFQVGWLGLEVCPSVRVEPLGRIEVDASGSVELRIGDCNPDGLRGCFTLGQIRYVMEVVTPFKVFRYQRVLYQGLNNNCQ